MVLKACDYKKYCDYKGVFYIALIGIGSYEMCAYNEGFIWCDCTGSDYRGGWL